MPSSSCSPIRLSNIWPPPGAPWTSPWKRDSKHWRRSVSWKCCQRMPPAITASPHLMTPSRAYCTALTLRFPRPFPCRVCGCPLGKNCSLNVFLNEYSYFTDFQCFGLGRKLRCIPHGLGQIRGGDEKPIDLIYRQDVLEVANCFDLLNEDDDQGLLVGLAVVVGDAVGLATRRHATIAHGSILGGFSRLFRF